MCMYDLKRKIATCGGGESVPYRTVPALLGITCLPLVLNEVEVEVTINIVGRCVMGRWKMGREQTVSTNTGSCGDMESLLFDASMLLQGF